MKRCKVNVTVLFIIPSTRYIYISRERRIRNRRPAVSSICEERKKSLRLPGIMSPEATRHYPQGMRKLLGRRLHKTRDKKVRISVSRRAYARPPSCIQFFSNLAPEPRSRSASRSLLHIPKRPCHAQPRDLRRNFLPSKYRWARRLLSGRAGGGGCRRR